MLLSPTCSTSLTLPASPGRHRQRGFRRRRASARLAIPQPCNSLSQFSVGRRLNELNVFRLGAAKAICLLTLACGLLACGGSDTSILLRHYAPSARHPV